MTGRTRLYSLKTEGAARPLKCFFQSNLNGDFYIAAASWLSAAIVSTGAPQQFIKQAIQVAATKLKAGVTTTLTKIPGRRLLTLRAGKS